MRRYDMIRDHHLYDDKMVSDEMMRRKKMVNDEMMISFYLFFLI